MANQNCTLKTLHYNLRVLELNLTGEGKGGVKGRKGGREGERQPGIASTRTKLPKVLPQTNKHIYSFKLKATKKLSFILPKEIFFVSLFVKLTIFPRQVVETRVL